MTILDERLKNVSSYAITHGIEKATVNFSLSHETISRYIREAKIRGMVSDDVDTFEKKPNILLLDIETAPMKASVWQAWKQNIYMDQIRTPWFMLTWSAKWLFDSEMFSDKLTGKEALAQDDSRISQSIWNFMDYADIIIAHNGDGFDLPKLNTRFLLNDIKPPAPYQSIDTLKVAKKVFSFEHNKLDYIARMLGVPGKIDDGGMNTWNNIVWEGSDEALELMEKYNQHDVMVLEEVYVKLRPWIKSHPNLSLYYEDMGDRCPNCGNNHLTWEKDKFYITPMNKYSVVRCDDCGAVGRSRLSALKATEKDGLISSTAR